MPFELSSNELEYWRTSNNECITCERQVGEDHYDWCDKAHCMESGWRLYDCDGEHEWDCWPTRVPLYYHGVIDCFEYGYLVGQNMPWPQGNPDLNMLYQAVHLGYVVWNRDAQRYYRHTPL